MDSSRNFSVTETTAEVKSGGTITLNYTGATAYDAGTAPNEYISAMIVDSSGVQYYGRIAQPTSADGQVQITIPAALTDGTYTLNVFSEQYNGDKKTDYASAFEAVALTVNTTVDTTAPTLTAGDATRTGETTATVKFTSDEEGSYYYEVVNSGENQPTIDTAGTGTACDTTEQTISLNNLSGAGAKDIYIVTKDAAGNVSQPLKITIPAYIAPSYGISASPAALNFGSKTVDYTEAPAAQTVTIKNMGNQNVTVNLPTSTNYIITAGEGFTNDTATLAPNGTAAFTVQPNTGLDAGDYSETLTISGSDGTSANVQLSFTVASATGSDKVIMRGAEHLQGAQADNIYFGTYQQSSDGSGGYNTDPIKWRVLENADGKLFLLSDQNLDAKPYNSSYTSITWEGSSLRTWLNGTFLDTAFSGDEQAAIITTEVVNDDNSEYQTEGGANTQDSIFLLSINEALNTNYGFNSSYSAMDAASGRVALNTAYAKEQGAYTYSSTGAGYWWLRSPGDDEGDAAIVDDDGYLDRAGLTVDLSSVGVRPAFNLDLNSVLFISAAVGGKIPAAGSGGTQGGEAADAIFEISDYSGNEWKLTLLDEAHKNFEISNATTNSSGNTIAFSYSGAQTGTNEYISVVIEDSGAITHYGRILQLGGTANGESGTASLTLPAGIALDDNTKLYVFNEQYNGDKMTDYASQLKEISSPTLDETAPTLSNGSATRDSATTATVKFTSNEAGSYYYVVDNSETAPDSIDTSGEGTSCSANTETTISLDSLSGAYIHIVVKDAVNNVSDVLTIQIPAYTFTVTVNVDPSEGGTASADKTTAAEF